MKDIELLETNLVGEKRISAFYLMRLKQIRKLLESPDFTLDQIKGIVDEAVNQAASIHYDDYYDYDDFYDEIPGLADNGITSIAIDEINTSKPKKM